MYNLHGERNPGPPVVALILTILVMLALAFAVERLVLKPLVNQPDIILFMATFGLTYFLIGFGEFVFGGEPKQMIVDELYLPRGVAHGFQTLLPDTELLYHISEPYHPELQRAARWNDPAFGIAWPISDPIMHERDRSYPDFEARGP